MSDGEPQSGARWWVADKYGIVTDPVGFQSTGPGEDWVPPDPVEEYQARLAASGGLSPVPRPEPPAPGTGTICISPIEGDWYAIWEHAEDGSPDIRTLEGPPSMTRQQAILWALGQPAARRMIYDEGKGDFLDVQAGDARQHS